MDELDTAIVTEGDASAAVSEAARKPKAQRAPKWEAEARDRLRTAIRRFSKPLADLVARDANEGDTRLLVTDFLCDGLGFDKYADLTTEYQVKGDLARELRIGRPDLPRQFDDGGLVDLNHVPAPVMVQQLGLAEAEAAQVVEARDHIGAFLSAEEVIAHTDLSPTLIDGIRERLVFLP